MSTLYSLSVDLLAGCFSFLAATDVSRAGRASRQAQEAGTLALKVRRTLSVVGEPPFLTDYGLIILLGR